MSLLAEEFEKVETLQMQILKAVKEVNANVNALNIPDWLLQMRLYPFQVGHVIGKTENTIRSWCRDGKMPHLIEGKSFRITVQQLITFLERDKNNDGSD